MNCPSCASGMTSLALDARLGATLQIDLCSPCRAIWFDRYEDLRLMPGATLKVFGSISASSNASHQPLAKVLRCPRCVARLLLTHDLQRNTPFQYWRCDEGHGRLITFIDFLREKDFVRPLTPPQLAELRENVQTINCSNCGAAIDLVKDSVCSHCGSAVSMLDLKQMTRTIDQLKHAAAGHPLADGTLGPQHEAGYIAALLEALRGDSRSESLPGLIEIGFGLLGGLLKRSR